MKKTIVDIDIKSKVVLIRCDFNVPMENGEITDKGRILAALPTIEYCINRGGRVVLLSHLGRPKGVANQEFSLEPIGRELTLLLNQPVTFLQSDIVVDKNVKEAIGAMEDGQVVLLENTRFRPEETKNQEPFTSELASLGEVFVNDAFGAAHRAHCSTAGIAKYLPAVSGFLIEKELRFLGGAIENPQRPFVAIMGGAKVGDKITVIREILKKVDTLIIGGGMTYTFMKAVGHEIGTSILDVENVDLAKELMAEASSLGVKLLLPVDVVCSSEFGEGGKISNCSIENIPKDMMGLDIGTATIDIYGREIKAAKTVIWNGPMGVFEMDSFANGTKAIAQAMADCQGTTIIGGGDSAAAVNKYHLGQAMSHVSTGGGASLEFLEGRELPGVAVLQENNKGKLPLIAGNWKMFKTSKEAREFALRFKELYSGTDVRTVICAPYVHLDILKKEFANTNIGVGAQNVHFQEEGAYTGEVSPPMLSDIGVGYCIVGHSERRAYFGENDETVNLKLKSLFKWRISPILCIGENLEQRDGKVEKEVVENQLTKAIKGLSKNDVSQLIIAYEPIWAIGTGRTATPEQAQEMCCHIRDVIEKLHDEQVACDVTIQYGGSMKPENASELMSMPDIDGGLVGGASLKAEDFMSIIDF